MYPTLRNARSSCAPAECSPSKRGNFCWFPWNSTEHLALISSSPTWRAFSIRLWRLCSSTKRTAFCASATALLCRTCRRWAAIRIRRQSGAISWRCSRYVHVIRNLVFHVVLTTLQLSGMPVRVPRIRRVRCLPRLGRLAGDSQAQFATARIPAVRCDVPVCRCLCCKAGGYHLPQ